MGRAIDLFVTYRFIKLLVTPFKDTDAYKLGIIDENGLRMKEPGTDKATILRTTKVLLMLQAQTHCSTRLCD